MTTITSTHVRRGYRLLEELASLRQQAAQLDDIGGAHLELLDQEGDLVLAVDEVPEDLIAALVDGARADLIAQMSRVEGDLRSLGILIEDSERVGNGLAEEGDAAA